MMTVRIALVAARAAATLVLITVLTSSLVELMPGDPARIIAGEFGTEAQVERIRSEMGLDESFFKRYLDFVARALHGDLGVSYSVRPNVEVATLIWQALPVTLSLLVVGLILAHVIGLPAGYFAARRRGGWADRALRAFTSLDLALPTFVLAILLTLLFAIQLRWLPAIGYVSLSENPVAWFTALILPALAVCTTPASEIARHTRGSMVETMEKDFIRAAESKGIGPRLVLRKHLVRNAALPILTVSGLQVARILGASVILEHIFALPGLGTLLIRAVVLRDVQVLIGGVLTIGILVLLVNTVIDLLYPVLDPRLRRP
jgi:peptide/nickel transport system permease protein